jgi:hypothetical protein
MRPFREGDTFKDGTTGTKTVTVIQVFPEDKYKALLDTGDIVFASIFLNHWTLIEQRPSYPATERAVVIPEGAIGPIETYRDHD